MTKERLVEYNVVAGLISTFSSQKDMFKSWEEGHMAKDEYKDGMALH